MCVLEKNMKMLQVTGYWIDKNERRDFVFYLRRVFVINVGFNAMYGMFVGAPMYMYQHFDNFSEVSESLGNVVSMTLTATAYFTFVLKNDELTELVQLLRNLDEMYKPTNEHTKEIYEKTEKLCQFWSVKFPKAASVLFVLAVVVGGVDAYQARDIENQIKCIYPIDLTRPGAFELAAFLFACNFVYASLMIFACNLMLLCMFLNILGQLRMLNNKMRSLGSPSEVDVLGQSALTEVESVSSMDEVETSNYDLKLDIKLNESRKSLRKSPSIQKDCQIMTSSDDGSESLEETETRPKIQDVLKECIAHHCELLNFVRAFEEYWNAVFSVQVIVCLAHSVLILTSAAMKNGDLVLMLHFGMVSTFYSMLGIFCYLAQQVTVESELLQESIYGCDWIESSKSFKKSIGIMVSVTNQPIVITAAGFVPLSLETFTNVLNSAYSSYMVLRNF